MKIFFLQILKFKFMFMLFFLRNTSFSHGQTLYALKIDRNIRKEATEITAEYQPRLVMGVDQTLEFKSTVAKYLVKKQAVKSDNSLSAKAKYNLLKRLSSQESSDMADVLESYRLQEYLRIKLKIQPIPKPRAYKENLIAQDNGGIN